MAKYDLQRKVAIVTGGAGGIGRVLVQALLGEGARVAMLDANGAALQELRDSLGHADNDPKCLAIDMDVSDAAACEDAIERTAAHFGKVHILINNAAIGMGAIRLDHMTNLVRLDEITPAIWNRFINTNLSGAFYMTRAVMPRFLEQGWGRVINISTSFFTMLRAGFAPYGPAKAGLESMTSGQAKEFEDSGVTVNVVVPGGPTDTPMVPDESGFNRNDLIPPEAMVPPVLWLCSPAAQTVTGNRYVAAQWDTRLPCEQAAAKCGAPVAWPELAQNPIWPGGKPE